MQETITARDVMHEGCTCIDHDESLLTAARMMRSLDVGVLPICGPDERLAGMITDRDIVVHGLALGLDMSTSRPGDVSDGDVIWCEAGDPIEEVLELMEENQVRRVPVVDSEHLLVGIISQGDIARRLGRDAAGELVQEVSRPLTGAGA